MKKILGLLGILMIVSLVGCVQPNDSVITVSGESTLTFDPDQAEVYAGVSIVGITADAAQNEVNVKINAIVDGLRSKGILEKDIETQQLNLYEERRWRNGEYKSDGWRATQVLVIKTSDLHKVGEIVDVVVSNGANQIQNINYGLSKEKEQEFKQQALAEATKNAKDKAETIALSLGVKLGKVKSVSESNYYYEPYRFAFAEVAIDKVVSEAAQILPRDVDVRGQITLVYTVK